MCRRKIRVKDGAILQSAAGAGLRVPLLPAAGAGTISFGFGRAVLLRKQRVVRLGIGPRDFHRLEG